MKTNNQEAQALIVVDYQNDFGKIGAPLYVKEGETLVPSINALMKSIKEANGLIIATRDWHPEKSVHFNTWPRHCIAGTPGADYVEGFARELVDVEIFKGFKNSDDGYSGFEGVTLLNGDKDVGFEVAKEVETLKEVLLSNKIKIVKIVGLATDYCIQATALDAVRDFETLVYSNSIRAVNIKEMDGEKAINTMTQNGIQII